MFLNSATAVLDSKAVAGEGKMGGQRRTAGRGSVSFERL